MKNCLKCGHQRLSSDQGSELECPKCGAIYAKVEAALAEKIRQQSEQPSNKKTTTSTVKTKKNNTYLIFFVFTTILAVGYIVWNHQNTKTKNESEIKSESTALAPAKTQEMIEKESVKNQLLSFYQQQLKDPNSAQFRNVKIAKIRENVNEPKESYAICGEVNAKNGFGGYTGFSGFVVKSMNSKLEIYNQEETLSGLVWSSLSSRIGCTPTNSLSKAN
jgi:predicted RNA-binding Zn-ribbon protein involved in translation (DUF1610 family)